MDNLIFAQLNTHHCKAAMANLSMLLNKKKVDILLNQEPYCHNGIPSLTPLNYIPFYITSNIDPRACIYIRREIVHNFTLLHSCSTPDDVIIVQS